MLTYLSLHHTSDLALYSWCLEPLLNQLSDQTDLRQVRILLSLLARLVWRPNTDQQGNSDEIVIFVKKQLNSGISFYRRVGVVGVVVCAKAMVSAFRKDSDSFGEPIAESSRNESRLELSGLLLEAQELLQFAELRTEGDPGLAGLFLDEMATSFLTESDAETETSIEFIKQIKKDNFEKLESEYMQELEDVDTAEFSLPMAAELDLVEEDRHLVVMIAKKVFQASSSSHSHRHQASLAKLMPTLRLTAKSMQLLGHLSKGDEPPLQDLVSLLGCSVLTFSKEMSVSSSQAEKNAICSTHFCSINWLIELINSFSKEVEEDVRNLVLLRLKQIILLRDNLQLLLKSNPGFKPPVVLFCEDTSKWTPPVSVTQNKKTSKGKGKKTKTVLSCSMVSQALSLDSQNSTMGTQVARIVSQVRMHSVGWNIDNLTFYSPRAARRLEAVLLT